MAENKILVIRGGAIGDFILTLPVLAALRRHFPASRLEVLGYAHIAQLAPSGGLADAVRSIEARSLAGFFARDGTLAAELQEYFAGFAVIISYLYDPDEIFQANVARCSKAQFIAGPHRPDDSASLHATEVFLKPLERLAIFDADSVPRLPLQAQSPSFKQLALHPGSGARRKNWPEGHWAELLRQLSHRLDWKLLLVGGEAEEGRLETLAAALPPGRVEIARDLPLVELAARLRQCTAFVGHDSGITHLASAIGLSGLVLWGDTVPAVWSPKSERMKILHSPAGLRSLLPGQVCGELETLMTQMSGLHPAPSLLI